MNYLVREIAYDILRMIHRIKNRDVIFEYGSKVRMGAMFEGNNKVCHHAYFSGRLGYASYIGAGSIICGKIGRFCSIADNVVFLTKTHPVKEFVSTHPAFYSMKMQSGFSYAEKQLFDEEPIPEGQEYSIEIGNDVYIGYGAIIIGPCKIGNGAVVAAGAVVSNDVPDYAIVGGVPSKIIKYRFSDEEIDFLEELQWWDKPQEWIAKNSGAFVSVERLKEQLKN